MLTHFMLFLFILLFSLLSLMFTMTLVIISSHRFHVCFHTHYIRTTIFMLLDLLFFKLN